MYKYLLLVSLSITLIFSFFPTTCFSRGHIGASGACYGDHYFFETIEPVANPRMCYNLTIGGFVSAEYYFLNPLSTKKGLYQIVELDVYEWIDGTWVHENWWRAYTEQPYIDEMVATLAQYGFSPNSHPNQVLPDGCPCMGPDEDRLEEAIAKCAPGELAFYSEEECKGVCAAQNLGPPDDCSEK
ncbi:hypothetical protein [Desulfofustis glycolicus]|uniref:Uncharacterized protein n=1 Tax=Desulfofustis glycolicus DSM 9705 TaxID=1121409 RepID=A0A1M5XTB9_9BACT|nr:hypothetical protein [Desulfofustis glycolicus]MCB2217240.1 hypothetical protein [Desulfobulbaceae bacterium]SHI03050.1 hypothetical protein SAMN02745124_03328 [Desulfofustis glycolicus DSM 9705]